jgi:hypothetical protein
MDDDHEFPSGHIAECMRAIAVDPEAVWIIGEYLPDQVTPNKTPACPGQLHPRGFSVLPPDPDDCWALADGATIYPNKVFARGLRFTETFPFGAAYLEFGSRLHYLGYRIRQLQSTYVIHHYDPSKRSLVDPEGELAAEMFAILCHSFIYQPTISNKLLSALQIALMAARHGSLATRALRRALPKYRSQRRLIETQLHRI